MNLQKYDFTEENIKIHKVADEKSHGGKVADDEKMDVSMILTTILKNYLLGQGTRKTRSKLMMFTRYFFLVEANILI